MKTKTISFIITLLFISCKNENKQIEKQKIRANQNIEVVGEKNEKQEQVQKQEYKQDKTDYNNQNPILEFKQIKTSKIGKINDPDGYSNLRKEQNSTSDIITRITENEYFFYHPKKNSNWYKIKDLNGNIGFIHKNRIIEVTNENLYKFSFTGYNPKTKIEYQKDTIIEFANLEIVFERYWSGKLSYESIPATKKSKNSISFKSDNVQVTFTKEKFNSNINKITRKDNYVSKINDKMIWGTDGNIPRFQLKKIDIIENGKNYSIPNNQLDDLFEPTLDKDYINIFTNVNNEIIIEMSNGDGAGGYIVIFILDNMKVKKRIIYRPF